MKYIFFGTPEFAAIILEKLAKAKMPPALVVCNPDKPAGRKKIITPPPVKIIAQKYDIEIWQPEKLETGKISKFDFAVVAAYATILPKGFLAALPDKFVGVHPSLLPKYRGATPIQSVILAGEKETGTTLFILDEKVDHGPILAARKLATSDKETYNSLLQKLAELSGDLLVETLPEFAKGKIRPRSQNEVAATYTRKFSTEDAQVDLDKDDQMLIERKVRALNPEPGVFTLSPSKGGLVRIKILGASVKDGKIVLEKIQIEGKKPQILVPRK